MSSIAAYGNTPIEERKKKLFHATYYEDAWRSCQGMLASLGTSEDNLPAFECTFLHWFNCMETIPMNVAMEAILGKLLEVERDAYFADLPPDTPEDVMVLHKAIIVDSLTNVKNFMSSFGVNVRDFFDQDKSRFSLHPGKGGKGGKGEQYPALKGKSAGKSTNRPKEPAPPSKKGGVIQLDKPLIQPPIPLVLHKPPAKAGMSAVATDSVSKAEPVALEQPQVKSEATVSVATPKAEPDSMHQEVKGEAVVQQELPKAQTEVVAQQEVPKAKTEVTLQQQQPKTDVKAVEKAGQPKSGGQSQSLLSIAGIKDVLGFGPSKPERPPPISQGDDRTQIEQDEEADLNAAIHASLQAPTSPQVQSGAPELHIYARYIR